MERVGGFVELFTQKVPAVCARQKNNPSTASGPPSFARKVKYSPSRDSTHLTSLTREEKKHLTTKRISLIRSTHYSPLTYSLIHLDTDFSRFSFHLKHPLLIQTLHSLILNTKKNELVSKLVFKFFNVVLNYDYSIILSTTPAPTVWPPSRIANLIPSSIATGAISSTSITTLSPGITI